MPGEPILDTQPAASARPAILETRPVVRAQAAGSGTGPAFTAGGMISRTLSAWWRHVVAFSAMSLVTYGSLAVWSWAVVPRNPGNPDVDAFQRVVLWFPVAWLVVAVLSVVQVGAVTCGTVRHLEGKRASLGEMLAVGVRRGLPVAGTGFLVWLGCVALGLLLFFPGVIFAVAACVAIPAAVIERPGAAGALSRSFRLTRGHRWGLLGGFLALFFIVWALALAVQVAVATVAAFASRGAGVPAILAASQLVSTAFSAIPAVGMAVAYHDLRLEKEGVDASELARVFE